MNSRNFLDEFARKRTEHDTVSESMIFSKLVENDKTFHQPVNWGVSLIMVALHLCALGAVFFFTWKAFLLAIFMWWVGGSLGIGMGYHRLLTHRGYKTPKWMEYFLTMCGTLAFEGGPIAWVATHRMHHQNTDKEGDPHSPRDGGIWAHMGWIITGRAMHRDRSELLPYVPDLRKDKFHLWISKWHVVPSVVRGGAVLRSGRLAVCVLGRVCAFGDESALYVAGEFGDAYVGLAAV